MLVFVLKAKGVEKQSFHPHPNLPPEGEGVSLLSLWERIEVRASVFALTFVSYSMSRPVKADTSAAYSEGWSLLFQRLPMM